jgi:hypothetical protein
MTKIWIHFGLDGAWNTGRNGASDKSHNAAINQLTQTYAIICKWTYATICKLTDGRGRLCGYVANFWNFLSMPSFLYSDAISQNTFATISRTLASSDLSYCHVLPGLDPRAGSLPVIWTRISESLCGNCPATSTNNPTNNSIFNLPHWPYTLLSISAYQTLSWKTKQLSWSHKIPVSAIWIYFKNGK